MKQLISLVAGSLLMSFTLHAQCWQQVSAGSGFSLGIKSDGSLWAWGLNDYGQLANGNTTNQLTPVQVGSNNDWQMISAGNNHVHAIKTDGTLWAWGYNGNGQLGTGGYGFILPPTQIGTDNNWLTVSAAESFSMALKTDGTLWGWGSNYSGETGIPGQNMYLTPQQVGSATDWQSVSTGFTHQTLAIKTNGTLWVCGDNTVGQLGTGDYTNRNTFTQIGTATNWQSVNAGYNSSHAIKTDGTLWSWGSNNFGKLGTGNNINSNVPVQEVTSATDWQSVSSGQALTLARKTNGSLWSWGYGPNGDNFISTNTPVQAGTENSWDSVSIRWNHTLATKTGNTLWAWGDGNDNGELGDGTTNASFTAVQVSCFAILPVTWLYANAAMADQQAIIKWATAAESNTLLFEIEHSSNGIHFFKIGIKAAAGNSSSTQHYSFLHNSPASGKNYYRIKQVDMDGRFMYSPIIILNSNKLLLAAISPNPVIQNTTIRFSKSAAPSTAIVLNANGQVVLQQTVKAGSSTAVLEMRRLPAGIYYLQLRTGGTTETHKLIKQ